jgi:hypothetical protein
MSSSETLETAVTETKEIRTLCRHIFTDGRRCASPALRGTKGPEPFCYHHHSWRKPIQRKSFDPPLYDSFSLPDPEDRSAIQVSIGHILQRICLGEIDTKRAGMLLYGLQIASANLPKEPRDSTPQRPIEQTVEDPELGTVAPSAEYSIRSGRRTEYEEKLESQVEGLNTAYRRVQDEVAQASAEWGKCEGLLAKATLRIRELESQQTLPTVQAVAEPAYPRLTPIRTRFYPKPGGGGVLGKQVGHCPRHAFDGRLQLRLTSRQQPLANSV